MFRIVLYILLFYMITQFSAVGRRQKKNQRLIQVIQTVRHPEEFFNGIDNFVATIRDIEFENKAKIIKLWGMTYNRMYDGFEETLNDISLWSLMRRSKVGYDIQANEDSFFYLLLAIPNMLWADDRADLRDLIEKKIADADGSLDGQLTLALHNEFNKFYDNVDDKGLAFYEKVIAGEYGEYRYSKSLIGLYKDLITCMSAQIYSDNGETDKFEECRPIIAKFMMSGVGDRWIRNLSLPIELPADSAGIIDAEDEVTEETEETEEKPAAEELKPQDIEDIIVNGQYTDHIENKGIKE